MKNKIPRNSENYSNLKKKMYKRISIQQYIFYIVVPAPYIYRYIIYSNVVVVVVVVVVGKIIYLVLLLNFKNLKTIIKVKKANFIYKTRKF